VELVKPVYNNIRVIISMVIPIIISLNNSVEIPVQGGIIICLIIYSNLSINKKIKF
jgi:hypothetical protein